MADAAVEFLLNNLKELLLYHSKLITETRGQIESLEKDLRVFKAFLKDSVKKRREDEHTKALVENIRDVVYEVEDVVDLFVTRAIEKKAKAAPFKFWKPSYDLHTIGGKVEEVMKKVNQAKTDFTDLKIDHQDRSEKPQTWPLGERDVVGFVDVTKELIHRLTQKTDYLDVVSLTGMFGLGKTTVAREVFNNPAIIYEFPVRIWLYISQDFSNKDIFLAIIKEFTTITEGIRQKDEQELCRDAVDHLEKVCFLIVMDDVWSTADWDRLHIVLPRINKNGKILITSRNEDVGTYASCPMPPKKLRFFTQEESWELLRLKGLRSRDCPSELESVGQIIAKNCHGLPLSVVVIGGILATKYSALDKGVTKKAWEEVSTQVNELLKDPANRVNKFISLSYDALPYNLRACFLYLGVFPEDYEIPVSRLICMWIGEGFIQQSNDSSLEETAEKYLKDLISRNLVTIDKFKPNGKVKTCRIHDTLREFCRTEAANENENFFQEIKCRNGTFDPNLDQYRRISIHTNCLKFIRSKPAGHRVRSFVCFSKDGFVLPTENVPHMLGAFELLRVLEVKPIKLTKITSHMYELIHVRYIALSLDMQTLPSKFSELWNIQTLIIDTTWRELAVKADIWKLSRLRHFKTNASATLLKPGKDSKHGAELQTLGTISVKNCNTEIFDRACNLKKLGIRGELALLLERKMESFDAIGKLKYLEKLKLMNDVYPRAASEGGLDCLPQPYQFPSTLKSLTLVSTFLSWESMYIIGLLDNLEILKLKDKAFMGYIWKAVDGGFRHLEFLQIEETDLVCWEASPHHFPRLRSLVLKNCDKLVRIPLALADVETLQRLEMYVCISAAASAKDIQAKRSTHPEGSTFKLSIFPPLSE
ncbi:putative late blight resistance protein R1B-16 [Salvia divinorum]|uniref:Late blight resistance protein R1B-16 n=1 Tax=Salvia divinorum TaxID=28513 RepID=A0ABD1H6X5_SALDI